MIDKSKTMDKLSQTIILTHLQEMFRTNHKTKQGREMKAFDMEVSGNKISLKRKDVHKGICVKNMGYPDCECGKC